MDVLVTKGPSTDNPDLRTVLRFQSSEIHGEIEKIWSRSGGFDSIEAYEGFLEQSLSIHLSHGFAAAPYWSEKQDALIELERIACLRADLGLAYNPAPKPQSMPADFAWGVAYVLNGSALGASMMLKHKRIPAHWPSRYFEQNRAFVQTGRLKHFFERLNAAPIDPNQAVAGAHACFAAFSAASPPSLHDRK